MKSSIATLFCIASASAFVPQEGSQRRPSSSLFGKNKGRPTNIPKPLPSGPPPADISLPEDCSMDDLMSVMGATRLKKIGRKNRRNRNQKIREGKVVLNEKGEWVPREEV